jgi:hypothetical protein
MAEPAVELHRVFPDKSVRTLSASNFRSQIAGTVVGLRRRCPWDTQNSKPHAHFRACVRVSQQAACEIVRMRIAARIVRVI